MLHVLSAAHRDCPLRMSTPYLLTDQESDLDIPLAAMYFLTPHRDVPWRSATVISVALRLLARHPFRLPGVPLGRAAMASISRPTPGRR